CHEELLQSRLMVRVQAEVVFSRGSMFTGSSTPTRRSFVVSAAALVAATAVPRRAFAIAAAESIAADGPFQRSTVIEIARNLAKSDFVPPPSELPAPIKNLT